MKLKLKDYPVCAYNVHILSAGESENNNQNAVRDAGEPAGDAENQLWRGPDRQRVYVAHTHVCVYVCVFHISYYIHLRTSAERFLNGFFGGDCE
jgi:hypothetical protein